MKTSIRIALIDDQQLLRDGLRTLLSFFPDIDVVGTASSGAEALSAAADWNADVLLLDLRMPAMTGLEALPRLLAICPHSKVIVLTTYDDDADVIAALGLGAAGYLLKDMQAQEIADAIRLVLEDVVIMPPKIATKVVAHMRRTMDTIAGQTAAGSADGAVAGSSLSERESEVLERLSQGLSNREIAAALYISEGTVKNHVSSIIAKLGLRDRTQAVIYALSNGRSGSAAHFPGDHSGDA
ncbi:MAG: response regulator [Bacilli bacterium]